MSHGHRRTAFTLIEVLIVVIIMAVLAATIIPQFASSTTDAKHSAIVFNLHTMRSQVEMYKVHHLGKVPGITGLNVVDQLTKKTDVDGAVNATSGAYGPYIQGQLPTNALNGLNTISVISAAPTTGDGTTGWQYDKNTGMFYPNLSDTLWDYTNDKPK